MGQEKNILHNTVNWKMQVPIFDLSVTESQKKTLKLALTSLTSITKTKPSVSIA